ncbi:transcription factor Mbp1p [Monosporozyma unispora]|nr:hypothetical protein C6P44_001495 [Kazachstania unispora]
MSDQIYSAKYSGVDVYELIHSTGSVMKRKKDNWVNATHILKAANFAKAKRTRILEKEVLKETHEKVQGGFGKYQGTWVPLDIAIRLAEKFGVYEELKPLFDYIQKDGDPLPPKAPKHHHATKTDGRKRATKSASMSALNERGTNLLSGGSAIMQKAPKPAVASSSPSLTQSQPVPISSVDEKPRETTVVTNPIVTRRRGRPPLSTKAKRRLNSGLKRSQSDMGFPRPAIPNSTLAASQLPQLRSGRELEPLEELRPNGPATFQNNMNGNHNNNGNNHNESNTPLQQQNGQFITGARAMPHFKELEINDGLSSDIEPSNLNEEELNRKDFQQMQQQQLQRVHGPGSSNASSPSLPTSPGQLDDNSPFSGPDYGAVGTSPIVSSIPKYNSQTRPQTSDINDNVNKYLSKLVDYFISNEMKTNKKIPSELLTPPMHSAPYIDVPIDPELHTAFHWACSMGTLPIIEALYQVGTSPRSINSSGQTPLMRSAMFHNSYTRRTFPKIFQLLQETVFDVDSDLQTVIHHIVKRKSSTPSAVYYLDIVLSKIKDFASQHRIELLLNAGDNNGDTALHIAAKNGDRSFFNTLLSNGALSTVPNKEGLTPNEIMNQHYEEEFKNQKNISNVNERAFAMADGLISTSDYNMYPSTAATKFSRGIPGVVTSMKDIADRYNQIFTKRDNELKILEKTLNNIMNNTNKCNTRLVELLNKNYEHSETKDNSIKSNNIDRLITLQKNETNDTKNKVHKLQKNLHNRLEKTQSYRLKAYMNNDEGGGDTDDDEEHNEHEMSKELYLTLNNAIKLNRYQLKRKNIIDKMIDSIKGNDNIPKYRKMISQGTEISTNEIDEMLNVILQSLENINGSK